MSIRHRALNLAGVTPYRFRVLDCGRAVIERFDFREREWLALHFDDSLVHGFGEMFHLMSRFHSKPAKVVCSHCEQVLDQPQMRRGKVLCDECDAFWQKANAPYRKHGTAATFFMLGVVVAVLLCAVSWVYAISQAGGTK
ncbi:hypothetical protein [Silvibacterium acidisoli]|uniref:hypothetical protein n=1 Tax=Acidobacteriaceae bacterium ZG23-2 TaxID=2883246 RepID=UPI00406CCE65